MYGNLRRYAQRQDTVDIRNNLAFCRLLIGDVAAGLENARKALRDHYTPLHELNAGLGEFLQGNVDAAKKALRGALQRVRAMRSEDAEKAEEPIYVLVLEPPDEKVGAHAEMPLGAAILINLWCMGDSTRDELETALVELYPEEATTWLSRWAGPR